MDNFSDKIYKVCIGVSLSCLIINLTIVAGMSVGVGLVFIPAIIIPTSYSGLTYLKKRLDEKRKKENAYVNQLLRMGHEVLMVDHKVDEKSVYFLHELSEKHTLTEISYENAIVINQFLYLVNSHYYERIKKSIPSLSRVELIDKIIDQIVIYIDEKQDDTFNEIVARSVLERCFFIERSLIDEIIKEFTSGKLKIADDKFYVVGTADNVILEQDYYSNAEMFCRSFDVENLNMYETLMSLVKSHEQYKEFENLDIDWDMEFIRDIMSFIVHRFKKEIMAYDESLYHLDIVISFLNNAYYYAAVNKIRYMDRYRIVNVFKDWILFPFELRRDMLDAIFTEFDLDYTLHPYGHKKKNLSKVFSISDYQREKKV